MTNKNSNGNGNRKDKIERTFEHLDGTEDKGIWVEVNSDGDERIVYSEDVSEAISDEEESDKGNGNGNGNGHGKRKG